MNQVICVFLVGAAISIVFLYNDVSQTHAQAPSKPALCKKLGSAFRPNIGGIYRCKFDGRICYLYSLGYPGHEGGLACP